MHKFSLAALTVLELDPPQMIECASLAGYDQVGLRLLPATPTEKSYDFSGDTPIRRACLERLRNNDVEILDIEILRVTSDFKLDSAEPFLESGAVLGAKGALVAADDQERTRLIDNLGRLAERCGHYGIVGHIEFMPWLSVSTLKDAVGLVNEVGSPHLSVLIDSFHFDRSHSDIADWTKLRGTQPLYAQLCDVPGAVPATMEEIIDQARGNRKAPGEGTADLGSVVRALGTETTLSIEVPERDRQGKSAQVRAQRLLETTREWMIDQGLV